MLREAEAERSDGGGELGVSKFGLSQYLLEKADGSTKTVLVAIATEPEWLTSIASITLPMATDSIREARAGAVGFLKTCPVIETRVTSTPAALVLAPQPSVPYTTINEFLSPVRKHQAKKQNGMKSNVHQGFNITEEEWYGGK
eukprot:gene600-biopygen9176